MDELLLRAAEPSDRDFAFDVMKRAFGAYVEAYCGWDEAAQRELHTRRFATQDVRIISHDGTDVGYAALVAEPDALVLKSLFIQPEHQSCGIGAACVAQFVDEAHALGLPLRLRVLRNDPRALAFYERLGLRRIEETESHWYLEHRALPADH